MKIKEIFHGRKIVVDTFPENAGIPRAEMYRVSTFNDENHYHDEISLTEEQWVDLKNFMDGSNCRPFSEDEINDEFQPRFGGANPKYKEFYSAGWRAAFDYVNEKLLKRRV